VMRAYHLRSSDVSSYRPNDKYCKVCFFNCRKRKERYQTRSSG
jgi:hypothetical protein